MKKLAVIALLGSLSFSAVAQDYACKLGMRFGETFPETFTLSADLVGTMGQVVTLNGYDFLLQAPIDSEENTGNELMADLIELPAKTYVWCGINRCYRNSADRIGFALVELKFQETLATTSVPNWAADRQAPRWVSGYMGPFDGELQDYLCLKL